MTNVDWKPYPDVLPSPSDQNREFFVLVEENGQEHKETSVWEGEFWKNKSDITAWAEKPEPYRPEGDNK